MTNRRARSFDLFAGHTDSLVRCCAPGDSSASETHRPVVHQTSTRSHRAKRVLGRERWVAYRGAASRTPRCQRQNPIRHSLQRELFLRSGATAEDNDQSTASVFPNRAAAKMPVGHRWVNKVSSGPSAKRRLWQASQWVRKSLTLDVHQPAPLCGGPRCAPLGSAGTGDQPLSPYRSADVTHISNMCDMCVQEYTWPST